MPKAPMISRSKKSKRLENEKETGGQLKIGNQWNAITIIALSQSNPLKAVAEFVEKISQASDEGRGSKGNSGRIRNWVTELLDSWRRACSSFS